MTTKGSLQVSITIVKAFLTQNFQSRRKLAKNLRFGGKIGSKCKILFSGPPKGTSLRESALFDVLIVKIGAGVLAVGCRKNQKTKEPKKLAESLDAHFRIFGGQRGVIVS